MVILEGSFKKFDFKNSFTKDLQQYFLNKKMKKNINKNGVNCIPIVDEKKLSI